MLLSSIILTFIQLPVSFLLKNSVLIRNDTSCFQQFCSVSFIFSGIVAGNIKEEAIRQIEAEGPFEIKGDALMMKNLDLLLDSFCQDQRMKLPTEKEYLPCYRILP